MTNWPQYILELENVYITRHGVILDKNFQYIKEANFHYGYWNFLRRLDVRPKSLRDYLDSDFNFAKNLDISTEVIRKLPDGPNYIHGLHFFEWYPFGHHFEILQPLQKLENLPLSNPNLLASNGNWKSIRDFDRHLELFGFPPHRVTKLNTREAGCTLVPKLFYSSPVCYFTQFTTEGLEYVRSKYSKIITPPSPQPLKLYLSRDGAKKRRVTNERQVRRFLKNRGFTILNGNEGLQSHIESFRNAECVVAPHGSMLNNIIFCPPNTSVIEFCPDNRQDHNFEGVGKTSGLDYHWIATPADESHNIQISVKQLENYVNDT